MKNNRKILIIGFGSIGQRHFSNLKKLGYHNISIYDPFIKTLKHPPASSRPSRRAGRAGKNIKTIDQLIPASLKRQDVAFICSPPNSHIRQALLAARAGCHLLIEKPLSHSLSGIDQLNKICLQQKLSVMIGHNTRFHPCVKFIKNYLVKKSLGKIYAIHHEYGFYLPYWRPATDYAKNYAARRATGGGIILDDIHEFDLLFWLNDFAPVKQLSFIYGKLSNLKIETEDAAIAVFKFSNRVLGSVRCDYLQQSRAKNCKIVGEYGNLSWDFNHNIVWLETRHKTKKLFEVKDYNNNQMYLEEVKYFMNAIKSKIVLNDLKQAKQVLTYCLNKN